MATAWAPLINGQPFFIADSTAYVRGPDFAIVHLFGKRFKTSWTQQRVLTVSTRLDRGSNAKQAPLVPLNSPLDKTVLAGRSIFYGALLYLGHVTSFFWLSVLTQAAIFVYLSYTLAIKCFRLSFRAFKYLILAVILATPVSFYVGLLMPDIFASYLILAMIIFLGFWQQLHRSDKVLIATIIGFSALIHASHLLLLICLVLGSAIISIFVERESVFSFLSSRRSIISAAIVIAAILGEFSFFVATKLTIGAYPIRPPFLMARVIADGPGYRFLQDNCSTRPYAACSFIDHMPTTAIDFLWSSDPKKGAFGIADLPTRRALSSEQVSFWLSVLRYDPSGVIFSAANDFVRQLFTVGIDEFFPSGQQLSEFKEKLPENYFRGMMESRIIFNRWILTTGNVLYSVIYFSSLLALVLMLVAFPFMQFQKDLVPSRQQLFMVLSITVMGIIFNAAICGVLSDPWPRYQARVSWIPLFVLLVIIARYSNMRTWTGFVKNIRWA